ncbi:MAG TPA: hypothetical protein VGK56_09345 [Anaerolineales bacterium]
MAHLVDPIEAVIISGPRRGEIIRLSVEILAEMTADADIEMMNEAQQFPLMPCESYTTMEADISGRVSTIHFRLLKRLSRFDMPGGLVESKFIS